MQDHQVERPAKSTAGCPPCIAHEVGTSCHPTSLQPQAALVLVFMFPAIPLDT